MSKKSSSDFEKRFHSVCHSPFAIRIFVVFYCWFTGKFNGLFTIAILIFHISISTSTTLIRAVSLSVFFSRHFSRFYARVLVFSLSISFSLKLFLHRFFCHRHENRRNNENGIHFNQNSIRTTERSNNDTDMNRLLWQKTVHCFCEFFLLSSVSFSK